jgi:hypothetical protein
MFITMLRRGFTTSPQPGICRKARDAQRAQHYTFTTLSVLCLFFSFEHDLTIVLLQTVRDNDVFGDLCRNNVPTPRNVNFETRTVAAHIPATPPVNHRSTVQRNGTKLYRGPTIQANQKSCRLERTVGGWNELPRYICTVFIVKRHAQRHVNFSFHTQVPRARCGVFGKGGNTSRPMMRQTAIPNHRVISGARNLRLFLSRSQPLSELCIRMWMQLFRRF